MDPFGDDDVAQLLRLKRYEQPVASYYENFLSEFRRRQRHELLRQLVWRICFDRAQGVSSLRYNVRPYTASVAAVISIRIYLQPVFLSQEQAYAFFTIIRSRATAPVANRFP
jgi:hypothetical protein